MAGVTIRYPLQIVLVLGFRFPEGARRFDFSDHAPRPQPGCIDVGSGVFSNVALLFVKVVNRRAITGAEIVALSVGCYQVEEIYGNGAVKNACAVLLNPYACYLKYPKKSAGGGCLWDFAATACIVKEAGGWVSDIYGNALDLNRFESLFMNHKGVVFCSSEALATPLLSGSKALCDKK